MGGLRLRARWIPGSLLGLASPASACPVCGVGQGGTASVYLLTAVLMCLVAFTTFGALAYYLFRQAAQAPQRSQERAPHGVLPQDTLRHT
jgi:hypothetical protein